MESDTETETWWPEEIEGLAGAGILWRFRPGLNGWLLFGEALLRIVRARHAQSQAAFLELMRRDMALGMHSSQACHMASTALSTCPVHVPSTALSVARRQLRAGQLQLQ